jgi:hypothetical protein
MLVHKLFKLVKGGIAFDSLFTNSVNGFLSRLLGHVNLPYACAPNGKLSGSGHAGR